MQEKGLIFDIKRFSTNDGPGIRTTIFFKGCPLNCWWCHNPESRSYKIEFHTKTMKLNENEFQQKEQIGEYYSVNQIIDKINQDVLFYDTSGGGVTFSGGEPLAQFEFLLQLAERCKELEIHTCIDTSGYIHPMLFEKIIDKIDLFLFDIKILDSEKHFQYTDVQVEYILQNLNRLSEAGKQFIIRFPVIPGINDSEEHIQKLANLLKSINSKRKEIHLLPYHTIAQNKYKRFQTHYRLENLQPPDKKTMESIQSLLETTGYTIKTGGI